MSSNAPTNVAVRLNVDGDAEVKAKHEEVGKSGEQAFDQIASGAERATAATDATSASVDRQAAKWARLAAAAQAAGEASRVQANLAAALDVGLSGKSAADSAAIFEAAARAEEDLERRTAALRSEIDPLFAAQQKLNTATSEANALFAAGKISTAEHTAALMAAQVAYDEAEKTARKMAAGIALSTVQTQELGAVAHRTFDAMAAGMNPMRVLEMEGARLSFALGSGPGGVSGAMKMIVASGAPAIAAVVAVAAALGGAELAGISYEAEQARISKAVENTSAAQRISVQTINQWAAAQAAAGQVSARMAADVETTLATVGRVTAEQLPGATTQAQQLAKVLGVDLKTATAELAKDLNDPAKGAQDLNEKLHFLTAAQVEQIKSLAEQGDKTQAVNLLLAELSLRTAGATDQAGMFARAGHAIHVGWDEATDSIGKFVAKLVGMPSGDAVARLAQDLAEIKRLSDDNPGAHKDLLAHYQSDAAEARRQIAAGAAQQQQQDAADQSAKLKAAFDGLDPQLNKIKEIQERQTQLRASLNDPKALAAAGLSRDQAQAALDEGDREIKQLKDKADGRDKHAESLAREAAAQTANAQAALRAAEAYLQNSAAGERAEAVRKALTDATKKGTDAEAAMQRQIALAVAESALEGAKAVATTNDHTAAQRDLNDKVAAGVLTAQQAQDQLRVEEAIRPQLTAYALAEGKAKEALAAIIAKLRDAYAQSNAEQARANLLSETAAANDRTAQLRLEAQYAGDVTGERERQLAILQVTQSKDYRASTDPVAKINMITAAVQQADQAVQTRQAEWIAQTVRDYGNQLELQQAELGLVGKTADEHDRILARLQAIQQLKAQGKDLSSDEAQAILAQSDNLERVREHLRAVNDNWNELKGAGDQFIDDVLSPQNWSDWRTEGERAITDIENEFIKLALINPLKNALFGEQLPTMSSMGGLLGSLFGGSGGPDFTGGIGGATPSFTGGVGSVPFFASGTNSTPGGLAWIAENGPELVNLPAGSSVANAATTRRMLSAANDTGTVHVSVPISIDARGAGPREVDALSARLDQLQRNLPALITHTVNDGISRRRIRTA